MQARLKDSEDWAINRLTPADSLIRVDSRFGRRLNSVDADGLAANPTIRNASPY